MLAMIEEEEKDETDGHDRRHFLALLDLTAPKVAAGKNTNWAANVFATSMRVILYPYIFDITFMIFLHYIRSFYLKL